MTFNSYTEYVCSPCIIHTPLPPSFLAIGAWMTLRLKVALIHNATWVINVLGLLFWLVTHGCLFNRALADVRSTGAGIKCLYLRFKAF